MNFTQEMGTDILRVGTNHFGRQNGRICFFTEGDSYMVAVGDKYTFSKQVTNEDVHKFAEVTGDHNPLHLDDEYAKTTMFGMRIAHGMIGAGIISGAIGMHLPGPGTTYLAQDLSFKKAVAIDDTVVVELEITEVIPKKSFSIAKISTVCKNQDGDVVIEGVATVIPPQ